MANSFSYQDETYHVGDRVAVHLEVKEEGKTRTQIFDGVIIAVSGRDTGKSFIIRRIASNNIGVERIIPLGTPMLQKIVVKSRSQVRRAKLYYLRKRVGRRALRVKEKTNSATATTQ